MMLRSSARFGIGTDGAGFDLGLTAVVMGLLFLLPSGSQAQGLADAAAKERERRKALGNGAPTRTFTDRDLGTGGAQDDTPSGVPEPAESRQVTPAETPGVEDEREIPSEEDERQDRLEAWGQMLQAARADVARCSAEVTRLHAGLGGTAGLYGAARSEQLARLEKAKQELATLGRAVEELENTGRRYGFREGGR